MDSQHYNAHPSHAQYSYYPHPHHPPNPNQINSPPNSTTLHPPGVDSYATLNSYYHQATTHVAGHEVHAAVSYGNHPSPQVGTLPTACYYQDTSVSQSWAERDGIRRYGADCLPHAGYSSEIDSLNNNASYPNNLYSDPLANDAIQGIPNNTNVSQSVRCEVCMMDCNSKDVLDRHLLGKKHMRNLMSQENTGKNIISPAISSMPKDKTKTKKKHLSCELARHARMMAAGEDVETKIQKLLEEGTALDSVMVCSMCNVVCNSQTVFNVHLAGKKHVAQVGSIPPNAVLPANMGFPVIPLNTAAPAGNLWPNSAVEPGVKKGKKKGVKKPTIVQSAWCEICSIECNSHDVLIKHKMGKKHQKKLEKLNEPPASTSSQITDNPGLIGPQENPSGKRKVASEPEEDVETKRHKMVSGGAAAEALKVCALCNVVCNSQTVFNTHLAGQKHLSMVKKQAEEASGEGATTSTTPDLR